MTHRARTAQERRAAAEARRARRAAITDAGAVMDAAATFLSVRSRSVEETRRRLRHLGYPPALVDEVVARLVDLAYLDDAAFAKAWVESRDRARPRGEVALRRELQLKGIDEATIRAVLAARAEAAGERGDAGEQPVDADTVAARALITRRMSSLARESDPRKRRGKAYALLARNGFAPDVCQQVAAGVVQDAPEEAG